MNITNKLGPNPTTEKILRGGDCPPTTHSPSSLTPETDEAWKAVSRTPDGMYDSRVPISEYAYAMLEHSKKMERERDAAIAALPVPSQHLTHPWDWVKTNQKKALRMVGISFRTQDELDLRAHVITEDPRHPLLCVNGDLNFGVWLNVETGMPEGNRCCICAVRAGDRCVCDL